jgi:hypothetical protein
VLTGTNFGPSTESDNKLHVSFTHAEPDGLSLTFIGVRCVVTTPHVNITCMTPAGIGALLVWTVFVDGQASYTPGTPDSLPPGVSVSDIATTYTRPRVRQVHAREHITSLHVACTLFGRLSSVCRSRAWEVPVQTAPPPMAAKCSTFTVTSSELAITRKGA